MASSRSNPRATSRSPAARADPSPPRQNGLIVERERGGNASDGFSCSARGAGPQPEREAGSGDEGRKRRGGTGGSEHRSRSGRQEAKGEKGRGKKRRKRGGRGARLRREQRERRAQHERRGARPARRGDSRPTRRDPRRGRSRRPGGRDSPRAAGKGTRDSRRRSPRRSPPRNSEGRDSPRRGGGTRAAGRERNVSSPGEKRARSSERAGEEKLAAERSRRRAEDEKTDSEQSEKESDAGYDWGAGSEKMDSNPGSVIAEDEVKPFAADVSWDICVFFCSYVWREHRVGFCTGTFLFAKYVFDSICETTGSGMQSTPKRNVGTL